MIITNFSARDLVATPAAFTMLGLFVLIPGYVLGALANVFGFQRRSLLARLAIAVCLSISVVPIATYLNWRYFPAAPWVFCGVSWLVFPVLLVKERGLGTAVHIPLSRERKIVLAVVGGWIVLGTLLLVDMQIDHRLYFQVASFDYALRDSFTGAIARTGVPPLNPFYHPDRACFMRYHYFWYMLCALVTRLSGGLVEPRIAVIAGTLWAGVALIAVACLYTQIFGAKPDENQDKTMLVAVALLGVTGLDILPAVFIWAFSGRPNVTTEWWNEQVTSWLNSTLWHPHSIVAFASVATGILAVWHAAQRRENRALRASVAICGAALAGAVGLSIYVALVFGLILLVWIVLLWLRLRRREAVLYCSASGLSLILAIPFGLGLMTQGAGGGDGQQHPVAFAIRHFYIVEGFVDRPGVSHWWVATADALSLPLNYFLEFGFFFVVAVAQWKKIRQRKMTNEDVLSASMLAVSVILCSFFRSNTIANNDLGWRGMLPAQFILLLWAAQLWDDGLFLAGRKWRSATGALLIVGALPAIYDAAMLRFYPALADHYSMPRYHWLSPDQNLGERTYALRNTYESLDKILPANAIVQQNPETHPGDLFYGLYGNRQTVVEGESCGVAFGGPQSLCAPTKAAIDPLFSALAHLSYAQVQAVCQKFSIDAVVVKDTDTAWHGADSWVWNAHPVLANQYSRAFFCRPQALVAKQ